MQKIVLVYGFEYEWKIYFKEDAILCKSIPTKKPFYAAPFIIEEMDVKKMIQKKTEIELLNKDSFKKINKLARSRQEKARWHLVFYGNNLKFDVGYESDGDENGDGR